MLLLEPTNERAAYPIVQCDVALPFAGGEASQDSVNLACRYRCAGDWRCEGSLNGPAEIEPTTDDVLLKADPERPVGYAKCSSVVGHKAIVTCVAHLFCRRSPAAVARLVVSEVVDAVDRVLWGRARSEVFKERGKTGFPARTNRDSSSCVVRVEASVVCVAAISHRAPNPKLWRLSSEARRPMTDVSFCPVAATTRGMARSKIAVTNDGCAPAIAAAVPEANLPGTAAPKERIQRDQPTKPHTGVIGKRTRHVLLQVLSGSLLDSHVTPKGRVVRGRRGAPTPTGPVHFTPAPGHGRSR